MFLSIFLIAVGLSADAFAVSISNGLSIKNSGKKLAVKIGFAFGFFQALMPTIGYAVGSLFNDVIVKYDHYIALIFLGFIGGKMLFEGIQELRGKGEKDTEKSDLSFWELIIQSIATSIDALIVGVSFIAMGLDWSGLVLAVLMIGVTTFLLSYVGVFAGKKFGELLGSKAEILGGIILIGIGLKIFIEHTFFGG